MLTAGRTTILLALSAALAFGLGCAADPGSGVPDIDDTSRPDPDPDDVDAGPDAGADVGGEEDTTRPTEGQPHLEFVTEQELSVSVDQRVDVEVRYVDAFDEPIADANLTFAYDEIRAGGTQLRSLSARTGTDGIGSVDMIAGPVPAEFEIEVEVRDDPEVLPITFFVTVTPKDSADYLIRVHYGPDAPIVLEKVDVFLFNEGEFECDEFPRDPDEVFGALDQLTVFPLADRTFPDFPYEARRIDLPLTHAIAIAYKEDTPVGMACADGLPLEIPPGSNTIIDLFVTELFPSIRGEFRVISQFDLLEFLPPTAQTVIRLIGEFFSSPGSAIFDILEEAGVFDRDDIPFGLDGLLADAIDGLLFELLPPEAVVVFESGADVYDTLQDIQMQGSMIFFEDADELGVLADCNELILDEIIVEFDTFDSPTFNLRSYGYQGAYGTFTGFLSVIDDGGIDYALNVQQFGLSINYGEIAVFVLETVIFPSVMGPEIDSMEDFVASFIDCEAIAEDVGWGVIESLCDTIIDAAVDGIRDFLTDQSVDVGSFYVLATPADGSEPPEDIELLEAGLRWGPCVTTTDTDAGNFSVTTLGGPGHDRCVWDARFRVDAEDPVGTAVPAAFDGFRLSTRVNGVCDDGR